MMNLAALFGGSTRYFTTKVAGAARPLTSLALNSTVKLNSGYEMPRLGFGVFQNDHATPAVKEALKAGYRHIDSAQYYHNEGHVATAIKASRIDRSDIFVTTKIMPGITGYDASVAAISKSALELDLGYIDLFLIHDPMGGQVNRLSKWEALLKAKDTGTIRSIGVSNFGIKHMEEIRAAGLEQPAVNQIELHPFLAQTETVNYCKKHGIVVQAYCPIVQGKLDNPVIVELSKKLDRQPAQVLLRWSLQKGYVPLPKSATPSRIHANSYLYDFELSPDDLATLDALDKGKEGALMWNPLDFE